jgi:phosphoribosyl 1,2-cyclic phosphodiesterase
VKLRIWGARGSVPAPGPETNRYGGNTSCVQVTLADGTDLILDAGTGIRALGVAAATHSQRINILLTHLHMDHIQGLMFFAPLFNPDAELVIWGPAAPEATLLERIARYISAPLSPIEVRELPCELSFVDAPESDWTIGSARIHAASVAHRGPTLGFRITDGPTSLAYIPDHEPALGTPLDQLENEWISGFELAREADLLIHDCQYLDDEYPLHVGWGHSRVTDALAFARRVAARNLLLFHHDPMHQDHVLDELFECAQRRWEELGGARAQLDIACESEEIEVVGMGTGGFAATEPVPGESSA